MCKRFSYFQPLKKLSRVSLFNFYSIRFHFVFQLCSYRDITNTALTHLYLTIPNLVPDQVLSFNGKIWRLFCECKTAVSCIQSKLTGIKLFSVLEKENIQVISFYYDYVEHAIYTAKTECVKYLCSICWKIHDLVSQCVSLSRVWHNAGCVIMCVIVCHKAESDTMSQRVSLGVSLCVIQQSAAQHRRECHYVYHCVSLNVIECHCVWLSRKRHNTAGSVIMCVIEQNAAQYRRECHCVSLSREWHNTAGSVIVCHWAECGTIQQGMLLCVSLCVIGQSAAQCWVWRCMPARHIPIHFIPQLEISEVFSP